MSRKLTVFISTSFVAWVAFMPLSRAHDGKQPAYASTAAMPDQLHRSLYPTNVECRYFDKTGFKTWRLRNRSTIDLGNWGGAFPIKGAIEPGTFVSNGMDLFDVLESKCGHSA